MPENIDPGYEMISPNLASMESLHMLNIVTTAWLMENLEKPDLKIIDCTNSAEFDASTGKYQTVNCRGSWEASRIPRSLYADFSSGFSGAETEFRNSLPDVADFIHEIEKLGISCESEVVLYDQSNAMWAARVWWMLRWIGVDYVQILDGGFQKWIFEGRKTEHGPPNTVIQSVLKPNLRPEVFVKLKAVEDHLGSGETNLIDALTADQFNGIRADLGLKGHIAGAVNIPAISMIDAIGTFKPKEELAAIFGHPVRAPTIVYCGSGIAAALVAFVMFQLGFERVSIYVAGLQEWVKKRQAI